MDVYTPTSEEHVIHEHCCGFRPELLCPGSTLPLGLLLYVLVDAFLGFRRVSAGPEHVLTHGQEELWARHRWLEQQILEALLDLTLQELGPTGCWDPEDEHVQS